VNKSSARIRVNHIAYSLISAFEQIQIQKQLTEYFKLHRTTTKWLIASDFVINEPQAIHDAYACTLVPYEISFPELTTLIKRIVPKDFKKTKAISPQLTRFLLGGATFTITLLTPKRFRIFRNLDTLRESIDQTISMMEQWVDADEQQDVIGAFRQLKQSATANNFNFQLISSAALATVLAAACAMTIAKYCSVEIIGWFPDRDNITTAYHRISDKMFSVNFSAFCNEHHVDHSTIKTTIGIAQPNSEDNKNS
jgi:hypothetical protein